MVLDGVVRCGAAVVVVPGGVVEGFVVEETAVDVVGMGDVDAGAVLEAELPSVPVPVPAAGAPMATASASATPDSAAGSWVTDWVKVTPRTAGVAAPATRTCPRASAVAPAGSARKAWNAAPASLWVGSTQLPVSVVASSWSPAVGPSGVDGGQGFGGGGIEGGEVRLDDRHRVEPGGGRRQARSSAVAVSGTD